MYALSLEPTDPVVYCQRGRELTVDSIPDAVTADVQQIVDSRGPGALVADDLWQADLASLGWSGDPIYIKAIAEALRRAQRGELDYVTVRAPTGEPISKGTIDFTHAQGPGQLGQLATHPRLQSLGIGTRLIHELHDRARARKLNSVWLGVEGDNPRGRALCERLGYTAFDEDEAGWESLDSAGNPVWYRTRLILMRCDL